MFSSQSLAQQHSGLQVIPDNVPTLVKKLGLTPVRAMDPTKRLHLVIGLPLRNQAALNNLLHELYDPTSPEFHQFLSHPEFVSRFGPDAGDYQAVITFAKANGFKIDRTYSDRMILDISGTVATIEKAFHVHMNVYKRPGKKRDFFAPDAALSLDLSVPISSIEGLNDYVIPHPAGFHIQKSSENKSVTFGADGSGPLGSYIGNDFRTAYAPGVSLDGHGQKVGLLEFNEGYFPIDISSYDNLAGLRQVPIDTVLIDGVTGQPTLGNSVEETIDIEMANAMAPGLDSIIVYDGVSSQDILEAMSNNTSVKQFSASWAWWTNSSCHYYFEIFAAQGQSFFNASGDWGAWDGNPVIGDTLVTIVGGTKLSTTSPGGSWSAETVWNDSGGGIDSGWLIPSYQQDISMSQNGGSTIYRNGPDVAMVDSNMYVAYEDGGWTVGGGTSYSSPLWAGFMAMVNQQAASLGNPSAGYINPALYAIGKSASYSSAFHDITTGNNRLPSGFGYDAVSGYDLCTGWGSPTGQKLINFLSNPVWSGTITLTSTYTIPSGQTLIILPGTHVTIPNGASLTSNGVIVAAGTASRPITLIFTGDHYSLIGLTGSGTAGSTFKYVDLQNGSFSFQFSSDITIDHCTITPTHTEMPSIITSPTAQ